MIVQAAVNDVSAATFLLVNGGQALKELREQ